MFSIFVIIESQRQYLFSYHSEDKFLPAGFYQRTGLLCNNFFANLFRSENDHCTGLTRNREGRPVEPRLTRSLWVEAFRLARLRRREAGSALKPRYLQRSVVRTASIVLVATLPASINKSRISAKIGAAGIYAPAGPSPARGFQIFRCAPLALCSSPPQLVEGALGWMQLCPVLAPLSGPPDLVTDSAS
jgi:hypothetical protein